MVFPRLGRDKVLARIERILGTPTLIEFDAGNTEVVLVPDFLVETADGATASVGELHAELRSDLAAMRAHEKRRHQQMKRARERLSRPMSVAGMQQPGPVSLA